MANSPTIAGHSYSYDDEFRSTFNDRSLASKIEENVGNEQTQEPYSTSLSQRTAMGVGGVDEVELTSFQVLVAKLYIYKCQERCSLLVVIDKDPLPVPVPPQRPLYAVNKFVSGCLPCPFHLLHRDVLKPTFPG